MATKRYELSDYEWSVISHLLPQKAPNTQGRPQKDNREMFNAIIWLARSGAAWRDLPERYGSWETVYSKFRKWLDDGVIDNIFRVLSIDAELENLSLDSTIVRAHQHCAGAKKTKKQKLGKAVGD